MSLVDRIINQECKEYIDQNGRLGVSQNAVTSPGALKCSFLIHAVGPYFHEVKEVFQIIICDDRMRGTNP